MRVTDIDLFAAGRSSNRGAIATEAEQTNGARSATEHTSEL